MNGYGGYTSGWAIPNPEPICHGKDPITAYVIVQECEHSGDMQETFDALKAVAGIRVVNWTDSLDGEYETGAVAINATPEQIAALRIALDEYGTAHVTTYAPERWTGRESW
jgi:hypothetical protein